MLRNYSPDEHLNCYLRHRTPNGDDYEKTTHWFKAEIITDLKKQRYEIISGVDGNKTTLQIRSSNCPFEIRQNDKVEVLGAERLVSFVALEIKDLEELVDSKYDAHEILNVAPKIIGLGD